MPQQSSPRFSVIVTTKNRIHYLQEALDSILAQDLPAAEVVIVDDGSDVAVADQLTGYDALPVRHVRHEASRGVSAARNAGARTATGNWVVFLDDDDWLSDDFLSQVSSCLQSALEPPVFIWSAKTNVHEGSGKRVPVPLESSTDGQPSQTSCWVSLMDVTCSGMTFNRTEFLESGGFDEQLSMTEDRDLIFRLLAENKSGIPCPSANLFFRIHDGPRLSNDGRQKVQAQSDLVVLERHQEFLAQQPALAERFIGRVAKRLWDAGYYGEAIEANRIQCRIAPGSVRARKRQLSWGLKRRFKPQTKLLS